mmetsp:Transcript_59566/g.133916  ORF Transcript_59566/g.133916 Transcript_59566/m.133916 type:complete len:1046 (+) Transcript_59566:83-3220(+)
MNGAAQSIDPAACKSRLLLAQRHADALTQLLVCLNEDFSAVSAAGVETDSVLRDLSRRVVRVSLPDSPIAAIVEPAIATSKLGPDDTKADLGTPDSRADSVPRDRADSVPRDRADTVSSYDAPGKTWNGTSHLTNMSEKMIATPTSETHRMSFGNMTQALEPTGRSLRPHVVFQQAALKGRSPTRLFGRDGLSRRASSDLVGIDVRESSMSRDRAECYHGERKNAWHPDSIGMTVWEACGTLAMLWDCFAIPWSLSFLDFSGDVHMYFATYGARIYWTINMAVLATTGYYTSDHMLERRLRMVARRYLHSWFLCDLILCAADWAAVYYASPGKTDYPYAKTLLVFVGLRNVRHLHRLPDISEKIHMLRWKNGLGSGQSSWLRTFSLVLFIILFNHAISCMWYTIGQMEKDHHDNWLAGISQTDQPRPYLYFTAIHWSLTQFLPGSMEVVPATLPERAYNVVVLVFGWVIVVTSTATLTSLMTQKRIRLEQEQMRRLQLQKYLIQERVEHALAVRIKREVKGSQAAVKTVKEEDVQDLGLLSNSLVKELSCAVHSKYLQRHEYFSCLALTNPQAFTSVCSGSITLLHCRADDMIFEDGTRGDRVHFVKTGTLRYLSSDAMVKGPEDSITRSIVLHSGRWCSEAALWCEWVHAGSLCSNVAADIVQISAEGLTTSLRRHQDALLFTCEFAFSVARLVDAAVTWSDLDLAVEHADVMGGTSRETRVAVGNMLLDVCVQHKRTSDPGWGFTTKKPAINDAAVQKLRDEIRDGACFVWLHNDELFRIVAVVALRLRRRSDGRFLAKLGEVSDDGSIRKAACELPGTKLKEQEVAIAAAQRFFENALPELAGVLSIQVDSPEHSAITQQSDTYGIRSRYLKTTYAVVADQDTLPGTLVSTYMLLHVHGTVSKHLSQKSARSKDGSMSLFRHGSVGVFRKPRASVRDVSSRTHISDDAMSDVLEMVTHRSEATGKEVLYGWLNEAEYDALQPIKGTPQLQHWLAEVLRAMSSSAQVSVQHHQTISSTISSLRRISPRFHTEGSDEGQQVTCL